MSYFLPIEAIRLPFSLPAWLSERVLRLRRITGFVTVYGEEADWRTAFFARLWHVQRVVEVAQILVELDRSIDVRAVERLAWAHDLNRWPFAHNSERDRFDQVADIDAYFGPESGFTPAELKDLKGINAKDPARISEAARVVLLADIITGLVEDPLFAVIGLNVHPELIPEQVDDLVGYSLTDDDFYGECRELAEQFHHARAAVAAEFSKRVHTLFRDLIERFLKAHFQDGLPPDFDGIMAISRHLRATFMRKNVFPINNDMVCHARLLQEEVMPWYFDHCGGTTERLLEMDEYQFVAAVTGPGSKFRPEQFRPDLDIVAREKPRRPFTES
jgi:hypothetical protein